MNSMEQTKSMDQIRQLETASPSQQLRLAFFCATYLQPEMLHVYRQITALSAWNPLVITQKAIHLDQFPYASLQIVPRSPFRDVSRFLAKQSESPWQISHKEATRIGKLLTEYHSNLLHIFFGNVAVHLLPLIRNLDIPFIVSFHGADVAHAMTKPKFHIALHEIFNRAEGIACRSESLAHALSELGAPKNKTFVTRTIIPDHGGFVRTPPCNDAWILFQACRLVPKKGIATTLRAIALLKTNHPKIQLHLAGEGPEQPAIEALIQELGLDETVFLHGFVNQEALNNLYNRSHVFIHPSEDPGDGNVEGIPNALLEAMMSGLPVVATRHGGISEAVRDGKDGCLCPEKDPSAIATALEKIFETPNVLQEFSRSARERVKSLFSQEVVSSQLLNLYEALKRSY